MGGTDLGRSDGGGGMLYASRPVSEKYLGDTYSGCLGQIEEIPGGQSPPGAIPAGVPS